MKDDGQQESREELTLMKPRVDLPAAIKASFTSARTAPMSGVDMLVPEMGRRVLFQ